MKGSDFTKIELLEGEAREVISTSIGATLVYDSRDFITNAAKGVYIKVNQRFFPKFLGNKKAFTRTDFIFDYYHRLWEGAILAFDLHGEFNYGDVPWNMLAGFGRVGPYARILRRQIPRQKFNRNSNRTPSTHLEAKWHSRMGRSRKRISFVLRF